MNKLYAALAVLLATGLYIELASIEARLSVLADRSQCQVTLERCAEVAGYATLTAERCNVDLEKYKGPLKEIENARQAQGGGP